MPNWCFNNIRIKGPTPMLDKFRQDMATVCGENTHFSYSFCTPMPEEYRMTTSPTPQSENEIREMAAAYNWEPGVLERKLEYAMTDEQRAFYDSLIEKYGSENWYDWANANWGTKWDACHAAHERVPFGIVGKDRVEISFDTAWAAPEPVIHALVRKYPNLNFVHSYSYEGEENTDFTVDYRMNEGVLEAMVSISTDMTEYEPWEDVSHMLA